jgi:hypothetical protein
MRVFSFAAFLAAATLLTPIASADVFDLSHTNLVGLCGASCGTVTVTFSGGTIHFAIDVSPNTVFGQGGAFGFNVAGGLDDSGVQITNIQSGAFSYTGDSGNLDGLGSYEFLITGPNAPGQTTLSFDVSRTGTAFTGLSDVYQASSGGNSAPGGGFFAAHIANQGNTVTGFAQTGTTPRPPQGQVPEPSSVVLLGTSFAAVAHLIRKRITA